MSEQGLAEQRLDVRGAVAGRLKARDVMRARRIIATRAAVERLQEVLGS